MRYLIAYDIADPKRLQRVARILERFAIRTQKSVFLFHGTEREVQRLLNKAAQKMNLREDIIQAWSLIPDQDGPKRYRGIPANLTPPAAVIQESSPLLIKG